MSDEEIAIFASGLSLQDATTALVGLALVRGAPDNTTVILVKAGPQEVTQYAKREHSWPLEDDGGNRASHRRPWIFLGITAISFFLCLASYSAYQSAGTDEFLRRTFLAVSIIMMGLSLGSVFGSFFSFALIKPRRKIKMITPGRGPLLGRGPYRHYDSSPTQKLFDRIIRSLHHAEGELTDNNLVEESHTLNQSIQDTKNAVQAGDFSLATQAVFNGLKTFYDTINSDRLTKTEPNGSA